MKNESLVDFSPTSLSHRVERDWKTTETFPTITRCTLLQRSNKMGPLQVKNEDKYTRKRYISTPEYFLLPNGWKKVQQFIFVKVYLLRPNIVIYKTRLTSH